MPIDTPEDEAIRQRHATRLEVFEQRNAAMRAQWAKMSPEELEAAAEEQRRIVQAGGFEPTDRLHGSISWGSAELDHQPSPVVVEARRKYFEIRDIQEQKRVGGVVRSLVRKLFRKE